MQRLIGIAVVALACLPARSSAAPSDPVLGKGIRQVAEGDLEGAVETLTGLLRSVGSDPARTGDVGQALLYLGVAYALQDQDKAARASFRQALQKDPTLRLGAGQFSAKVSRLFDDVKGPSDSAVPSTPPAPTRSRDSILDELTFWQTIMDADDPRSFEDYLARCSPSGFACIFKGPATRRLSAFHTRAPAAEAVSVRGRDAEYVASQLTALGGQLHELRSLQSKLEFSALELAAMADTPQPAGPPSGFDPGKDDGFVSTLSRVTELAVSFENARPRILAAASKLKRKRYEMVLLGTGTLQSQATHLQRSLEDTSRAHSHLAEISLGQVRADLEARVRADEEARRELRRKLLALSGDIDEGLESASASLVALQALAEDR